MINRRRATRIALAVALGAMLALAATAVAVAPVVTITSSPTSPTSNPAYSVSFTSDDPAATYACSLDGGAYGPCSSPATGTVSGDGAHTLSVTATNADNETSAPATATWTVDTTGPSVSITGGPAAGSTVASASAAFTFTSEAGATFQCSLDGGGFSACSSPQTYTGLASGTHTFAVRAIDVLGNTGSAESRTWTVDVSPPETTITSGPSGTTGPDVEFTFSSSEAGSFECSLDGSGFAACASPRTYTGLASGSHTFSVRAIDTIGNVDPTPATQTWTVDAAPPNTTITGGPAAGATVTAAPTFTFTASEPATFQCSLDGAGFSACTSPYTPTLTDGAHTFAVRAVDTAGNIDPTPASRAFTVDSTPPTASITSSPTGATASTSASVAFSANEPASFQCSLDGGGFSACTSPAALSGLADGSHTFSVRATDTAGNVGSAVSATWSVDTTAPNTTIDSAPTGTVASRSATIAFSASESGSSFECRLDGAAFAACSSPTTVTDVTDGNHVFDVRAKDGVGNVDATPASTSWSVDATPPVITLLGPTQRTVEADGPGGAKVEYTVTASDGGLAQLPAAVKCSRSSGSTFPFGTTEVECKATDAVGNEAVVKFEITVVDTTPPTINAPNFSVAATSPTGILRTDPAIAQYLAGIGATDLVSKPVVTTDAPESFPLGTSRFTVTAVDDAGNRASKTVTVTVLEQGAKPPPVDLTPPTPIRGLKAKPGDGRVTLTWVKPGADVARVEIRLRVVGETGPAKLLGSTLKTSYIAKRLRNDVQYRFELVAVDRAGNAAAPVTVTATPKALLLARPLPNAKVTSPPLLKWRRVAGATYYNVQLYRGAKKVLSTWPTAPSVKLRLTWRYDGKKHILTPGTYTWYVWPGLGARADARYGPMLGKSKFKVVAKKTKKPKKAAGATKTGARAKT